VSSYTKWDWAGYIERAGGGREGRAAAQDAHGAPERVPARRGAQAPWPHPAQPAEAMGITPGPVSQIERGEVATIDAIARYIEALGGRLDLVARFGDHPLTVATSEAA
jgi:hypothetical protein